MSSSPSSYVFPVAPGKIDQNNEYAEMMRSGNAELLPPEQQQQQQYKEDHPSAVNRQQAYQPEPADNAPTTAVLGAGPKSGRRSKRFWIILAVVIVVVVAVAVGVGVGVGVNKGSSNASAAQTSAPPSQSSTSTSTLTSILTSTSTSTSASTGTAEPVASPTALTILSAVYGLADVTADAKSKLQDGNDIVIDTDAFPFDDSWYGVVKCLSLLHRYSNTNDTGIRTFVGCERQGEYTLVPGAVSLSNNTQAITGFGPTTTSFRILSVVWQSQEIRDQAVYQKLFETAKANQPVVFSNELFGVDTSVGNAKAAAIFYTTDGFDTIKSIYGKEGGNATFTFL